MGHHNWHSWNRDFIGQLSHVTPRQPMRAMFHSSKDVEEGLELVVLYGVDPKHVLSKELDGGWDGVGDLGCKLFDWPK